MLDYNMKDSDVMNDDSEKIYIDKTEYDALKKQNHEIDKLRFSDFAVKIYKAPIMYDKKQNNIVKIEIFSSDFMATNMNSIQIDGKYYNFNSQILANRIKEFVANNLEMLISLSKKQTNSNLDNNAYEGGIGGTIIIKYGQLIININGQVRDVRNLCDEFIEKLKKMILDENPVIIDEYGEFKE